MRWPTVCWVGHCLGGLVIHRLLERYPDQPPGRVVFLASPSMGNRSAASAGRFKLLARLMGKAVTEELLGPRACRWAIVRHLGTLAGTRPLGLLSGLPANAIAPLEPDAAPGIVQILAAEEKP